MERLGLASGRQASAFQLSLHFVTSLLKVLATCGQQLKASDRSALDSVLYTTTVLLHNIWSKERTSHNQAIRPIMSSRNNIVKATAHLLYEAIHSIGTRLSSLHPL
jgi:hypothetical protein